MISKIQTNSLTDGLVLYLPFNGNAKDESGNGHTTTVNGATLTTDRFGNANQAYYFDGKSFIEIFNSPLLNIGSGDYTIAAWINIEKNIGNMRIFGHGSASCSLSGYQLRMASSSVLHQEYTCPNHGCNLGQDGQVKLNTNNWYFVTNTVEKNHLAKLYVNSILDVQTSAGYCDMTSNVPGYIGYGPSSYGAANNNFIGKIDDLIIYNRALSNTEVTELYYNGISSVQANTLKNGLLLYLPISKGAKDESDNNHAVIINGATLTYNRLGIEGEAYHFAGNANIMIQNSPALNIGTGDYSIVAWVKLDKVAQMRIYNHGSGNCNPNGPNANAAAGYMLRTNQYNQLHQEFTCTTGQCGFGSVAFSDGKQKLSIGQWYFVANTVQRGSDGIIYINGIVDSTIKGGMSCDITYNNNPLVGFSPTEALYGDVDQLMIYNRALSNSEVTELYYKGLSSLPKILSTNYKGISTLREDEAQNQCFKADLSFTVDGEAESLSYIALEEASSYEYTKSDKYTGSAHLEALMAASLALKSSVSYKDFKAVSGNSYSTTIGVVHKLPVSFVNPTLSDLGKSIYQSNTPEDFKLKCGDKIPTEYMSFITVTATLNYIFKSSHDVYAFKTDTGVSAAIGRWLGGASVETSEKSAFSKYDGYLSLKIEQFGGNPTSLVTAIGNSLAFCSLSSIEGCSKVITNIKTYVTSPEFKSQLQHDKWNTRVISDIDSEPISSISEIDSARYQSDYINADLSRSRSELINKLTEVTSDYNYMKGLLAFIKGESCQPSAVYSNGFIKEVQDSLSVIETYMKKLTDSNSGIPACYSDYKNCVNGIAPVLLKQSYDYSEIAISKAICEPIECESPGYDLVNQFSMYEDWYVEKFFQDSYECYYGCFATNSNCAFEEDNSITSDGTIINHDIAVAAAGTMAAFLGVALL